MSPTILFKGGEPFAAYGSPGGSTIINTVLQITLDLVDHGMTIQQAIDAPRISTGTSGVVSCEVGPLFPLGFVPRPPFARSVRSALIAMGHSFPLACSHTGIGSAQGVVIDLRTGEQYGGADHRREGTVVPIRNAR
jgi:gamma-glutamyltranspeptidase/glutathione hydrolase